MIVKANLLRKEKILTKTENHNSCTQLQLNKTTPTYIQTFIKNIIANRNYCQRIARKVAVAAKKVKKDRKKSVELALQTNTNKHTNVIIRK